MISARSSTTSELSRHACHVSAWLALGVQVSPGSPASPVSLLVKMLRRLPQVTPRLQWCLQAVERRLGADIEGCGTEVELLQALQALRARALHRCMARWQAMPVPKQRAHAAELRHRLLEILSGEPEARKEQLLDILQQTVAALSAPRALAQASGSQIDGSQDKATTTTVAQKSIRDILVKCLELRHALQLDCGIHPSIARVKLLIQQFEERHGDVSEASSGETWAKLKSLTTDKAADDGQPDVQPQQPDVQPQPQKRKKARSDCAVITDTYSPNKRVRSFRTIVQRPEAPKLLKCSDCPYLLSSAWYFCHPTTHKCAILMPGNGHALCRRTNRLARFRALDGSAGVRDSPTSIDFCQHNIRHQVCVPCGGVNVCDHGRTKWDCPVCRHSICRRVASPAERARPRAMEKNGAARKVNT